MTVIKSGIILLNGIPASDKSSYANALKEVLLANGKDPVVLTTENFPLLNPESEPAWTRAILSSASILGTMGKFTIILAQLNDSPAIEEARSLASFFKEVYLKCSPVETAKYPGWRFPKLPDLAINVGANDFESSLKQILDWLANLNVISKREEMGSLSSKEMNPKDADLIREKLKSLGYL